MKNSKAYFVTINKLGSWFLVSVVWITIIYITILTSEACLFTAHELLPERACLCEVCWPAHISGQPACHTAAQPRLWHPAARTDTPTPPAGRCSLQVDWECCSPGSLSRGSTVEDEGRPQAPVTPKWHDGEKRRTYCRRGGRREEKGFMRFFYLVFLKHSCNTKISTGAFVYIHIIRIFTKCILYWNKFTYAFQFDLSDW